MSGESLTARICGGRPSKFTLSPFQHGVILRRIHRETTLKERQSSNSLRVVGEHAVKERHELPVFMVKAYDVTSMDEKGNCVRTTILV